LTPRLMVEAIAMAVFRNMAVDQPNLLAFDSRIAFGDRPFALAQGLHLRARELDAGLEPLFHEIVEPRAPVLGHDLLLVEGCGKRLRHQRSGENGVGPSRIRKSG